MKKALLIMLSIVIFFDLFSIYNTTNAIETLFWQEKIDDSVYKSELYNGKRMIHIFRKDITEKAIADELYSEHGYEIQLYENDLNYEQEVKTSIAKKVELQVGTTNAYTISESMRAIGENLTPVDEALIEDYENYIEAKRKVVRRQNSDSVDDFVEKNNISKDDIIYRGEYSSSIILYATDDEIEKYAKCDDVEKICVHEEGEIISLLSNVDDQIDADSINGTKSDVYNSGAGYRGAGVKIGIIEKMRFDSSNPHLSTISSTNQLQYVENEKDGVVLAQGNLYSTVTDENNEYEGIDYENHATIMTAIIVGQPVSYNGDVFEGIVPNATVYQTCAIDRSSFYNAFNILANNGVTVINFSMCFSAYTSDYSVIDKEIDKMIESSGITFLAASGNYDSKASTSTYEISSPALAYNAITVGNVITQYIDGNNEFKINEEAYYISNPTSCYVEETYLTNKPDLSAPGTQIGYFDQKIMTLKRVDGTSPATAIATGVVAQIHENMNVKLNYTRAKAHLLFGATKIAHRAVDEAVDDNNMLYKTSGIGLINAKNSIEAMGMLDYGYVIFNTAALEQTSKTLGNKTFATGDKIRVVMTFNKPENIILNGRYQNNVDIFIYNNSTNELIASSENIYNNVEAVEFIAPVTDSYRIEAKLTEYIIADTNTYLDVIAVWHAID